MAKTFNRTRFGAAVRAHRDALGLTQEQAAAATGIPQTTLSPIERGIPSPLHETVGKLCSWMGRDMEDFWDEEREAPALAHAEATP